MGQHPYLTVNEIAGLLQVDPRTVQRLIREKLLPAHRIGKEYRVNRNDFDQYMRGTRTTEKGLVEAGA